MPCATAELAFTPASPEPTASGAVIGSAGASSAASTPPSAPPSEVGPQTPPAQTPAAHTAVPTAALQVPSRTGSWFARVGMAVPLVSLGTHDSRSVSQNCVEAQSPS